MSLSNQLANHLHQVIFGGNWTASNLKDQLDDVTFTEATKPLAHFNSILALTFHIGYYITAILGVFKGQALNAKDKYSFDHPKLNSQKEWEAFKNELFDEAEQLIALIDKLPEERLNEVFVDEKYGSYQRNIIGLIEHTHYHLGQIAILKKHIRNS
ncbi:MAG: DUF1572 domain-containing protein [Winogradskyella sp.]|nr:DUF1572 domain-containing protein [Winogradskyella sp.]